MSDCLQYGCGWDAPEGWRNFDASPTLRFERIPMAGKLYTKNNKRFPPNVEYGDVVKGLPVAEASYDLVYSSHVLEHLALCDFREALKNTFKVLRPNGCFRFVLPDLEYSIRNYCQNSSKTPALDFMHETLLGLEKRPKTLMSYMSYLFGNSRHLWMWDFKSISYELENAGFVEIRRAKYGDSMHQLFSDVEKKARWLDCLGIECFRP